jgi:pentose-5-phosphate-3-epimerase
MNNEMMPLFVSILQSEELKKQSERIIQEVRTSSDGKRFTDELIAYIRDELINSISSSDVVQLMSVELKTQSDRIIDEVSISKNAKRFADEFVASVSNSEIIKQNFQFQKEQLEKINRIINFIENKKPEVDGAKNPDVSKESVVSADTSAGTYNTAAEKEDKKSQKK